MKRKIYRSIDKSSEFFGIKSGFLIVFGGISCFAAIASIMVGTINNMFLGFGFLILAELGTYFLTIVLQSKYKERQLFKILAVKGYPTIYSMKPKHIRNLWRGFSLQRNQSE